MSVDMLLLLDPNQSWQLKSVKEGMYIEDWNMS